MAEVAREVLARRMQTFLHRLVDREVAATRLHADGVLTPDDYVMGLHEGLSLLLDGEYDPDEAPGLGWEFGMLRQLREEK